MTERTPMLIKLIDICMEQRRVIVIRPYKFGRKTRTVGVSNDQGGYEYRDGLNVDEAAAKLIQHLKPESTQCH